PAELAEEVRATGRCFGRAVTESYTPETGEQAQAALSQTARTAEQLTHLYVNQVFQVRHQREAQLGTALGCRLYHPAPAPAAVALTAACNSVAVPFVWSTVESNEGSYEWQEQDILVDWAEQQGLSVSGGPVLDFSSALMPAWLWL